LGTFSRETKKHFANDLLIMFFNDLIFTGVIIPGKH
jgi:hypothetical protein